jgi:drug/metabolite transporter (DMT)-like permease
VPRTRGWGLTLAFGAACLSGISVFVNAEYVGKVADPTVFTTAKNAVAALVLLAFLARGRARTAPTAPLGRRGWAGLVALGLIGGSVPFVLFFEGLARSASPVQAGFVHKTLVVWVALLAVPLLRERFTVLHAGAVVLLIAGEVALVGGLGGLHLGAGEGMILAATLLWSVEFVLAKRLLRDVAWSVAATARLAIGVVLLVGFVGLSGRLDELAGMGTRQWRWALLTGLLLAAFVATWYAGLARAQAVDVTAVLVFGQVVTALLSAARGGSALPDVTGLVLLGLGVAAAATGALRLRPAPALS